MTLAAVFAARSPEADAAVRNRRIISTSGIPHTDVADYQVSPFWETGMPKGINGPWRTAFDAVIGQIAGERPNAVLHTGDMVEGRWGEDYDGRGVFGPVGTFRQKNNALKLAADVYYPQMKAMWARHGLQPHFGIGDHEYGDIGRSGLVSPDDFRYRALGTWRWRWAKHFTGRGTKYSRHPRKGQHARTAYAQRLGDLGLITIDPVLKRPNGTHVRVSQTQRAWMREVVLELRANGVRWIAVQCEVPARGPNRARGSSRLLLENADAFWNLLIDLDVDLLLSAEYHAMTTHTNGGRTPVQVVHGGSMRGAHANWLVIDTFDDRLELQLKAIEGDVTGAWKIWSPSRHRAPSRIAMGQATSVGTMVINADGSTSRRTGYLREGID